MKQLKDIIAEQHEARAALDDPFVERLLSEVLRLAEEVCVARDRLDTCQILAASGAATDAVAIDAFEVDAALLEERLARHKAFFEEVFARVSPG